MMDWFFDFQEFFYSFYREVLLVTMMSLLASSFILAVIEIFKVIIFMIEQRNERG